VTEPVEVREREPQRLEAFSDGVLAVIITIMAFNLQQPKHSTWVALRDQEPALLVYLLSFAFIGIYWNNHHHLLRATEKMNATVMWANLHLLFWLSLIPVLTKWVSLFYGSALPAAVYGVSAFGAGVAFSILVTAIIRCNGRDSEVARAVGSFAKGKLSLALYAAGVGLAWVSPWISYGLYAMVSIMWFIPDPRLSRRRVRAEGTAG
jgi:uncharacterized membrane protein